MIGLHQLRRPWVWIPGALLASGMALTSEADTVSLDGLRALIKSAHYGEAESAARRLLSQVESRTGTDSVEAAEVIDLLLESLWRPGKTRDPAAPGIGERAVAIKEKVFGPNSLEVAATLQNLAALHRAMGDFARAKPLYERTLLIRERALGPSHLDVAATLTHLAVLEQRVGRYSAARPLYERAFRITQGVLGLEHPDLARAAYNLATFLVAAGDFPAARPLYEQALAIMNKESGPGDIQISLILNSLSNLLEIIGDYDGARTHAERALAIRERVLGPDHPDVAASLNNLAFLQRNTGDLVGARIRYERSLSVRLHVLGPDNPLVAQSLHNLADLLIDLGDYSEARKDYERALMIREKTLGPESPEVAGTLQSLGRMLSELGDYSASRSHYERALTILEKVLGPDHVDVAATLDSLGSLLQQLRDYPGARTRYERALAIREKALGTDHPDVAESLHSLGNLMRETGEFGNAQPVYERALLIRRKSLGRAHPATASLLNDFAQLLAANRDSTRAFELSLEAETISRDHLRLTARTLSERQALGYASVRSKGLDVAFSIAAGSDRAIPSMIPRAFDALIRSRTMVLDEMAARNRAVGDSSDKEISGMMHAVHLARERLARLVMRGASDEKIEQYVGRVETARLEKEQAERALAEKSLPFREEQARNQIGFAEVARHVPSGFVLVAFAVYDRYRLANGAQQPDGVKDDSSPAYLAFVLRSGDTEPRLVPLGDASQIEESVGRWREELISAPMHGRSRQEKAASYQAAAGRLRDLIWKPLARHLLGARQILIVPDGALNLVNFAALPADGKEFLLETGPLLHYLSAERDLILTKRESRKGGLMAIGDPAFDDTAGFASLGESPQRDQPGKTSGQDASRRALSGCADFATLRFEPLPASGGEALAVSALWDTPGVSGGPNVRRPGPPAETLIGSAATEGAVKTGAPGHRVLHVATHGFFLGHDCRLTAGTTRGIGGLTSDSQLASSPIAAENPLIRAGLALAGANRRASAGAEEEDGVLTAEEIGALDLSGMEWAVLSGCDTGLGELEAGEGVLGLRRAFQIAGARTVIMSLWPVEDDAARLWMSALYKGRLARGLGTAEAVREANLELLRWSRNNGRLGLPFDWAAFVAVGDWR